MRHLIFAAALLAAASFPAMAGSESSAGYLQNLVTPSPQMCLTTNQTWEPCGDETSGPAEGAVDYAELHPEGAIQVSIFPCNGVRITAHKHVIYEHPAHCAKKRDDD